MRAPAASTANLFYKISKAAYIQYIRVLQYSLVLRNAHAFPLLPAALASVSFGFVLVRVRVRIFENSWVVPHTHGTEFRENSA